MIGSAMATAVVRDAAGVEVTEGELFSSSLVRVGYVRCPVDHRSFRQPGCVTGYRFVFPRHGLWMKTSRSNRFVSDASIVEYHGDGDEFSREPLDPRGDCTEWYEVREAAFRAAVGQYDPAAAERAVPLRFSHAPTDHVAYAVQRRLSLYLESNGLREPMAIEETVMGLLDRALAAAYRRTREPNDAVVTREERDIANRAKAVLSQMTSERASLATIGRTVGVSVFHLSRVFRKVTGRTLAKHHVHLRLLESLTPLNESGLDLEEIATSHGFAGHSHYTTAFRRVFGFAPSRYRALRAMPRRRATDGVLELCSRDRDTR